MESGNEGFTKNLPFVRSEFPSDTPLSPVEVIILILIIKYTNNCWELGKVIILELVQKL